MIMTGRRNRPALLSIFSCVCLPMLLGGCGGNTGAARTDTGTDSESDPISDTETDAGKDSESGTSGDTGTAADSDTHAFTDTDSSTDTDADSDSGADSDGDADGDTDSGSEVGIDTTPEVGTDTETDTELNLSIEDVEANWVTIPAGEFVYGSPETQPCRGAINEEQVDVVITRPFRMAATEITRAQWRITKLPDPSGAAPCDECPQDYVNWYDTLYWLNRLSRSVGLPECYELSDCLGIPVSGCAPGEEECWLDRETKELLPDIYTCANLVHKYPARVDCPGYRLPTSAEWEWAARGGTTTATYNGDIAEDTQDCRSDPVLNPIGWYCGNVEDDPLTLRHTALLQPNAYGLYDMLGNAEEWTSDVYTGGSLSVNEGKTPPLTDPIGISEMGYRRRFMRGGGILQPSCRSTATNVFPEQDEIRSLKNGFRPVRTLLE